MSERARLTALYGGLLVLAGALLTGLVYFLVREGLGSTITSAVTTAVPMQRMPVDDGAWATLEPARAVPALPLASPTTKSAALRVVTQQASKAAEDAALGRMLTVSGAALAVFSVLSVALAWWLAGRVLRPVGVITATARRLSGDNLRERIALKAPAGGELKQLADTFDGMLDRIEQLVSAQQRFAANAAHELRTPLAVQRAAAEIGLAGEPDADRVARIRTKLIEVADDSEQLIEGLLLLSVSEQGLRHREPCALRDVVTGVLERTPVPDGITVTTDLRLKEVTGDEVLLGHLVQNLLGNALRYNHPAGTVRVRLSGDGVLEVSNTGPAVDPAAVPRLFEPFRRARERRHAPGEGAGLGLSIVASIARAHGAKATARANPEGGLTVRVAF
ncbi:sensor histidine kinase [Streptomyces sp. NPDC021093]|uniref:sensor histidine kinase n=1 Tax=Streptomyces sp. NPDC021093 TaxID=3365112 RepID=UPI0037A59A09